MNISEITVAPLPPFQIASNEIKAKYNQLGGETGLLGKATTDLQNCPDAIGFFIHFQGGSIYWSPSTGAHEVHGDILGKWASIGWERSLLGYPLTDETPTPDGIGRFNHFQGGSIYWSLSTGAHEVHGDILGKWASIGWERSLLGYPLTDETPTPDGIGRFNHFQGGSVYWSPSTGAHEVHGAIRDKWASIGWERSFLGYPTTDEMDSSFFGQGRVNNFQHGDINWSPATGAIVSPEIVHFNNHVTTQDWASIGGWLDVVISSQGNVTFSGHMHNSGFLNIDYALAVVIMTPFGIGYTLSHQGSVDGTITVFGRNRDNDWTDSTANQQIVENWDQISQARLFWRFVAQDTLSQGIQGLIEDLAEAAVQEVAEAGVKALIALI
ncbi:MAG: hypothetical protein KME21_26825 [Desmonostoc vinosum HA7617-LM4]|jgi:uncharacterized protein with LGFP repeats|nr:hypothetical protein [Desmonostoc vinosum HA7617-LM4]